MALLSIYVQGTFLVTYKSTILYSCLLSEISVFTSQQNFKALQSNLLLSVQTVLQEAPAVVQYIYCTLLYITS